MKEISLEKFLNILATGYCNRAASQTTGAGGIQEAENGATPPLI
jgi:hypothetical protein